MQKWKKKKITEYIDSKSRRIELNENDDSIVIHARAEENSVHVLQHQCQCTHHSYLITYSRVLSNIRCMHVAPDVLKWCPYQLNESDVTPILPGHTVISYHSHYYRRAIFFLRSYWKSFSWMKMLSWFIDDDCILILLFLLSFSAFFQWRAEIPTG